MTIYYRIENNYPVVSFKKLDGIFLEGTKETVDGIDIFTPQELQDTINDLATKEANDKAIAEAKAYLANTDYKMLPNYVPKVDEDLDAIIVKRNETREFIRNNNA